MTDSGILKIFPCVIASGASVAINGFGLPDTVDCHAFERTLAMTIGRILRELRAQHPQRFLEFGEVVVSKGGGYGIARACGSL